DGNYPVCIGGACAKACVSNDSKESNDNSMEAKVVADGSDFDLNLCNEVGTYHDTEDWFYFTLNGAAYLSVITNNDPHDGDFDLTLFDSGLSVVDSSSSVFYG